MDITKKKKLLKRLLEYGFILVLLATVGLIYFALAKDIAIIIADSKTGDYSAVKNHLQELGFEGAVSIAVLEMLQMIVIFIPAEFCQIAAGLAFPIYYAVPICVVGLTLGSIVIFAIVRLLHIRLEVMEKRMGKVQKFVKKNK